MYTLTADYLPIDIKYGIIDLRQRLIISTFKVQNKLEKRYYDERARVYESALQLCD